MFVCFFVSLSCLRRVDLHSRFACSFVVCVKIGTVQLPRKRGGRKMLGSSMPLVVDSWRSWISWNDPSPKRTSQRPKVISRTSFISDVWTMISWLSWRRLYHRCHWSKFLLWGHQLQKKLLQQSDFLLVSFVLGTNHSHLLGIQSNKWNNERCVLLKKRQENWMTRSSWPQPRRWSTGLNVTWKPFANVSPPKKNLRKRQLWTGNTWRTDRRATVFVMIFWIAVFFFRLGCFTFGFCK